MPITITMLRYHPISELGKITSTSNSPSCVMQQPTSRWVLVESTLPTACPTDTSANHQSTIERQWIILNQDLALRSIIYQNTDMASSASKEAKEMKDFLIILVFPDDHSRYKVHQNSDLHVRRVESCSWNNGRQTQNLRVGSRPSAITF